MKRVIIILFALLWFTGCRSIYNGEPFTRIEYTLNGDRFVYEYWGYIYGGSHFDSESKASLYLDSRTPNEETCRFSFSSQYISLQFEVPGLYLIDGQRYDYYPRIGSFSCLLNKPQEVVLTSGWFSMTRHTVEPYCRYDVHFELHGEDAGNSIDITDGIIQVGRRMDASDISGIIKKEEEL